ncbi:MAG: PHP domain-containing protein [Nitrospirota bacterium]|jgi:PHP family Zn ribbon phosphoesterase
MRTYAADLHIHTCLSPCAELDMTPRRIVEEAARKGLDIIAVTDHNSAENAGAAVRAGERAGLAVLPAMEITSGEEAHVLGFFPSVQAALRVQEAVYASLPRGAADGRDWQVVVNESDEVESFNRRLLFGATAFGLKELVALIRREGGLAVASHVDRGAFSVSSQMGFVPEDLRFDAVEVLEHERADQVLLFHPGVTRLMSSDAHHVEEVGRRRSFFTLGGACFEEIALALRGAEGRGVRCPA